MNQKKPRGFLNEAVWPDRITVRQDAISESYAVETRPFARGKFATVRRCRHIESGRDFAAKYLRKRRRTEDVRHELIHEALVLALADDCERIISLKEIFETPTEVILVLEMAAGGELQHVLDSEDCLPERSVRQLLLQIAEGLAYLHSQHIAHLDIKPANLLLSAVWPQVDAKLCDFGISRLILPGEEIHEIAGTPDYIAPEVLQYEPISLATDMWSLGILTYVLLTGHTPFGGDTKQDTYCNITLGELDFPQDLFEDVTPEAVHFITQLVVKDPKKRLNVGDVLKHPWLTQPSPCPSSMSIAPVIGITNDEMSHLISNSSSNSNNNNKPNSISNGSGYNPSVGNDQSPNRRQEQEAVQRLCNASEVQCETPSSSSMGSCEESDTEITMEDQQQQQQQQIVNDNNNRNGGLSPNLDSNCRRSTSSSSSTLTRNGVVIEAQETRSKPATSVMVNEIMTPSVAAVAIDNVVPNSSGDNGVQLGHSQTTEQLVEVHDSSEEESECEGSQSESDSDIGEDAPVQITDVTDEPESQAELEDHSATPIVTDSEDVLQSPNASHSNIHVLHKNRKILLSRLATKEQQKYQQQLLRPSGSVSSTTTSKSVSATDMHRSSVVKRRPSKKSKVKSKSQSNLSKGKDKSPDVSGHKRKQDTVVERSKIVVSPEGVTMQSVRPKTPVPRSPKNTSLNQNGFDWKEDSGETKSTQGASAEPDVATNIGVDPAPGADDTNGPAETSSTKMCSGEASSNGYRKIKVTVVREGEPVVEEPCSDDANNSSASVDQVLNGNGTENSAGGGRTGDSCKSRADGFSEQDDDRYEIESVTSEKAQKIEGRRIQEEIREQRRPRSPELSVFDRINQRAAKFMDIGLPLRGPKRSPRSRFNMTDFVNADDSTLFRETNSLFQDFQLRHGDLIGRFMMDFPFRNRDEMGLGRRDLEKVHLREYNALAKFDTGWQYEKDVPVLSGERRGRCPFSDRLSRFDGTPRPRQNADEEKEATTAASLSRNALHNGTAGSHKQYEADSFECEPDVVWQYQDNLPILRDRTGRTNGHARGAAPPREAEEDFDVDADSMWQYQEKIPILSRPPRTKPVEQQTFEESIQHRRQNALRKMGTSSFTHAGDDLFTADDNDLISRIMGTDLGDGLPVFRRAGYNDSSAVDANDDETNLEIQPLTKCSVQRAFNDEGDSSLDRPRGRVNAAAHRVREAIIDEDVVAASKPKIEAKCVEKPRRGTGGDNLNRLLSKLDEWAVKIKNVRHEDDEDDDDGDDNAGEATKPMFATHKASKDTDAAASSSGQGKLAKQLANATSKEQMKTRTESIVETTGGNDAFKGYSVTSFSSGVKKTMCYQRTEVKKV